MAKIGQIREVAIADIIPYERNAKKHSSEQVEKLQNSIKEFGFLSPCLIDENNNLIAGHGRVEACKKLGWKKVPCISVEGLTEAQRRAYILADNRLTELGEWDMELVNQELDALQDMDFDIELTGFEIQIEEAEEVHEDDFDEDEPIEQRAVLGDVWQLGEHRLMCGDSTSITDVAKLMNGHKADMVFTDPPYGMKKEKDGVLNDNLNFDDLLDFNRQWIPISFDVSKDNGSWYCWGIDEPLMDIYSNILRPMIKEKKIAFRNLITWDKGNGQGQLSNEFRMYPIADEKCLFVMIGSDSAQGFSVNAEDYSESMDKVRLYLEAEIKKLGLSDKKIANDLGYKDGRSVNHWYSKSQFALPTKENYEALREYGKKVLQSGDFLNKDWDFLKKDCEFLRKEYDELKNEYYSGRSYFDNMHDNMNNVWHFLRTNSKERELTGGHATPKPIELCARAIKSSSRVGEIVLDVFGGSGSTLIACEQLERKCFMMELDPHYVDVIINRWEKITGKTAKLLK